MGDSRKCCAGSSYIIQSSKEIRDRQLMRGCPYMILTLIKSPGMVNEFILGLPFLTGIFVLTSLCITWCRGVDPVVSPPSPFHSGPGPALIDHTSSSVLSPQ